MKGDFIKLLNEIDALIKGSRVTEARHKILGLTRKDIPLSKYAEVAALARRANALDFAITLLKPVVYPSKKILRSATERDLCEYAASLLRIGAIEEASGLLSKVSSSNEPEALLFQAMIHFKKWEYSKGEPLLRKYAGLELPFYQKQVAKVNLALCLLFTEQYNDVERLLFEVVADCEDKEEYLLILANAYRLIGNLYLGKKQYVAGLGYFEKSAALLQAGGGLDYFLTRKWIAISEFFIKPLQQDGLLAIEAEAKELQHWETLRELDYYRVLRTRDKELTAHLYFGTSFPEYRERIKKKFPEMTFPSDYLYTLGNSPGAKVKELEIKEDKSEFRSGMTLHRLYSALLTDFYRPFSAPTLFEKIFPGEHYTPKISTNRVYHTVIRLRNWFKKSKIPLRVENVAPYYCLSSPKPVGIRVRQERGALPIGKLRLERMREELPTEFKIVEVANLLGLARRTAGEFVQEAVTDGILEKSGKGTRTRYTFVKSSKEAA